jgi:hypothetical protein
MAYFPLSQIKTNLFTNGYEFTTNLKDVTNSYSGYYWKTSAGRYYTGRTPQDLPTQELFIIPNLEQSTSQLATINNSNSILNVTVFDSNPITEDYLKLKSINPDTTNYVPYYNPVIPTQQDYQIGQFRRYFVKKTNEIIYIETDKQTVDKIVAKDPQILWQLYYPFFIDWQLTGDKQEVAKTNRNMVLLASKNQKLPALSLYLKEDYTKYYQ